jgi:hypothetical protein
MEEKWNFKTKQTEKKEDNEEEKKMKNTRKYLASMKRIRRKNCHP